MRKKLKAEQIDGIKHIGKKEFKQRGRLIHFVDQHSLGLIVFALFCTIVIEMLGFAFLYKIISSSSCIDSLNYSFLSVLGETAEPSVHNSLWINWIISFQSILTNCIISFFMAIVLYKLINIKPELIKMEKHPVYDPRTGTLKLRVVNASKFKLLNVHINATFRIFIQAEGRHSSAKLQLKTDNMNVLHPFTAWNIATKPLFTKEDTEYAPFDLETYDKDRLYDFRPDLLIEEYRPDNEGLEYTNLNVTITVKSPLFGNDWVYHGSYKTKDFVCGTLVSIEKKEIRDWTNFGLYEDMSGSYCSQCPFVGKCGIVKKG